MDLDQGEQCPVSKSGQRGDTVARRRAVPLVMSLVACFAGCSGGTDGAMVSSFGGQTSTSSGGTTGASSGGAVGTSSGGQSGGDPASGGRVASGGMPGSGGRSASG